ncbi:MAG TPA: beta-L-arabinofuranosidase domain-containing protein [Steroidobacteraceae bacterium]|nr:beta-L-arabinofuranosidase domain-containing protein [Steroidobacteraceae bacterium]
MTRRRLLAAGALAAGGGLKASYGCRALAQRDALPLTQLNYGQVQLLAGPLERQARENHRLVLNLDEDSLLRPFRVRAGMAAPGQDLGGWYDTYAFAPGATFGQWVSALSRHHAITGDLPTRAKVHRLVRGYAQTVDPQGSFYRNNRFPSYIYDKLVGGLIDARTLTEDDTALATLARATDAAMPYLPPHAMARNEHAQEGEDFSQHAWDESYTIPENQFFAWHLTGQSRHRELARRFLYDDFFMSLADGNNVLPGKHAYSHVNGLSSAAQAYLSLDAPMYLRAAKNGFSMIAAQSYATGGWGPDEHFIEPGGGALGASLARMHKSFETPCGAYAHFKLTRYLLRITRDARYGDSMERVLYNTVLGATPLQPDGHAFYYSDYTREAIKSFHPDRWPCCSGTLPMIAADYSISSCFTDGEGIYVNLYVPAVVGWRQGGSRCSLRMETEYPYEGLVRMTLALPSEQTLTVNLRIPAWANGASLAVNGKRVARDWQPGTFAALRRAWRAGDFIELELPRPMRLEPVDAEHPDTVALLCGPLVLMRLLDEADSAMAPLARESWLAAARTEPSAHEWLVMDADRRIRLRPFMDIGSERYSAYLDARAA